MGFSEVIHEYANFVDFVAYFDVENLDQDPWVDLAACSFLMPC
jgi:hypothetical protein